MYTVDSLNALTVVALKEIATAFQVKFTTKTRKPELIDSILSAQPVEVAKAEVTAKRATPLDMPKVRRLSTNARVSNYGRQMNYTVLTVAQKRQIRKTEKRLTFA